MKLILPALLVERLRERGARLERLAHAIADDIAVWRARARRHRLAIAVLGGGIAGAALASRWRSLLRFGAFAVGATVRAAALSAVARARVRRAVAAHLARASRPI